MTLRAAPHGGAPPPLDPNRVLGLARRVLADLDLDAVLDRVLESARDLTSARYAALGVLDESRRELARFLTLGMDDATRASIGTLPRGRGVLGELIANPRPLRLRDVGAHPHSYGFPGAHPPMTSFLGVPIVVDGQPYGNLYLTDKRDAVEFSDDDERAVLLLAELAGVAIDHARRYTGSEQRRADLQRTVSALDATLQIARAVGGEIALDRILELVAKRGRALVAARALVIEHLRGHELVVAAVAGEAPAALVGQSLDVDNSVASTALRTRRSQWLEDRPNRTRFQRHGVGRYGLEATAGLVVPLLFRGEGQGVLVAIDRLDGGPAFSAEDEQLLVAFAASAATAIATASSVATDRQRQRLAAAEEERGRWARELHDETLQNLAAIRLGLAAAQRAAPDAEALAGVIGDAVRELDQEIAGLRAVITELRPAALDQLGVAAAIEALVHRARRMGLEVDLELTLSYEEPQSPDRLSAELETAVYRIVQEALTNVRKHGAARRVGVRVAEGDGVVSVEVCDDGCGFDTDGATRGFGMAGMQERAELVGGRLRVASSPGGGTVVAATLPARWRATTDGAGAADPLPAPATELPPLQPAPSARRHFDA